ISAGLDGGKGAVSGLANAMPGCDPAGPAIAGREALGKGGSIGSSVARVAVFAEGRRRLGGRFASATVVVVVSGTEARITGGGGEAQPQSNGTSLLSLSILHSCNTTCSGG